MLNKAPNNQLDVFTFIFPTIAITHQNEPQRTFYFHMDIDHHHRISRVYPNENLNEERQGKVKKQSEQPKQTNILPL